MKRILKKILIILPDANVDWLMRKFLKVYELIQIQKDIDEKRGDYALNFKSYLPETEKRIEHLRKTINKKPVVIILPGSSVKELEQRIEELSNCDVCYASLNDFWAIEKHILNKTNKHLSIVMCASSPSRGINEIIDFLERKEDNFVISSKKSFSFFPKYMPKDFNLNEFIQKYDKKLLFHVGVDTSLILTLWAGLFPRFPSKKNPLHFPAQNSLSILIFWAIIGQASKIVIFGGDGGRISKKDLFFREQDNENRNFDEDWRLMVDTEVFNAVMPLILKKIYKTYNIKTVDIINCSEKSHYTPFRKLSYEQTFALLKKS